MIPIHRHKKFVKQFKKFHKKLRDKFEEKIIVFMINPYLPELNNHSLTGKWKGCQSINITGDYWAIYYMNNNIAVFMYIGTHHQLHGK